MLLVLSFCALYPCVREHRGGKPLKTHHIVSGGSSLREVVLLKASITIVNHFSRQLLCKRPVLL